MKKVILKDDKNNTVHGVSFSSVWCNHIPINEDEYEIVTTEEMNCPKCIEFDKMLDRNAQIISDELDDDILDEIDRWGGDR